MYNMTVALYFLQSSQNCDAENLLLRATVLPTSTLQRLEYDSIFVIEALTYCKSLD